MPLTPGLTPEGCLDTQSSFFSALPMDQPKRISKAIAPSKPQKPYADFPLFAHATKRWAKKIRGKTHYFGPWDDPLGALQRFQEQRDDLFAGRKPRSFEKDGVTVRDLCNQFLTDRQHRLDAGELVQRTWNEYHRSCSFLLTELGRDRLVEDLRSEDFVQLRKVLTKNRGPVALGNEVSRIRVVFNFAFEAELVERPIRFGPSFKRPSNRVLRQERAKKPKKRFSADAIQLLIRNASPQMAAMIYLGINCGLGNGDIGRLEHSGVDLKSRWLDFPRPKSGMPRTCPLWTETVAALERALAIRTEPRQGVNQNLVFVTKYGSSWYKSTSDNPISQEFRKLLKSTEVYQKGVGFYALRHTFETEAGESRDQVAVDHIMGHVPSANDMSAVYREGISKERLKRVTDHVNAWLFAKNTP